MDIFTYPPLTSNFTSSVVNAYMRNDWYSFIRTYGSHFVYELTMGGRVTYEAALTTQGVSEMNTYGVDLNIALQAKFAKIFSDDSFNYNKNGEEIHYLDSNTQSNRTINLGGSPP